MNPLFCGPIHGIACVPYCDPQKVKVRHHLNIDLDAVKLDTALEPIWRMQDDGERYQTNVALYKQDQQSLILKIDCQGSGLFKFKANELTIDWQKGGTDAAHYFQTLGIALWLELKNVLCIHANALAYGDAAIALMAPSRGGKTTMSAALCQKGFALMTDDMMALHGMQDKEEVNDCSGYQIYPSWPVARMWPDALSRLQAHKAKSGQNVRQREQEEQYEKVHQQFAKRLVNVEKEAGFNFCDTPKKLSAIYLLNRVSPEEYETLQQQGLAQVSEVCFIRSVPAAKALILLLQNSILGGAYRALNIEARRLTALSVLLQTVKFKQVTYLNGSEYLDKICEAITEDCKE